MNKPVSARVLDAAIAWRLRLDADEHTEAQRHAFDQWHAADSEHARAWLQLGMLDQRFSGASPPARKALMQPRDSLRRRVRSLGGGLAGVLLVAGLTLLAGERYLPIHYWLADQRTATGEQRTLTLDDGTLLSLNTHSAVDVRFDAHQRLIVLQEGEVAIETGHQNADQRPFIVATRDGTLRALGTRFLVKREDQGTRLSVLQSAVVAQPEGRGFETVIREGQQVLMQRQGLDTVIALKPGADAWTRGMLVADNMRLADLTQELTRYRSGYLGISPEVADLRVSGSFPLHDTDLALQSLVPTLPVRVERRTEWWVVITGDGRRQRSL